VAGYFKHEDATMTAKDGLHIALVRIAGPDAKKQLAVLQNYSEFTPESGEPVRARSLESMSEKWAKVTLDRVLAALHDGTEHFQFNENGERVQYTMFKEEP
jgi:hypothetical protein